MAPLTEPAKSLPPGMAAVTLARVLADELSAVVDAYAAVTTIDLLARLSGCPEATAGREGNRCRAAALLVHVWDTAGVIGAMTGVDPLGADVRAQAAALVARARRDAARDDGPALPSPTTRAARILAAAAVETGGVFPAAEDPG